MNRRADVSLTFALCASLVLHGLLSLALAEAFVRDVGARIWLPPPPQRAQAATEAEAPLPRFDLDEDPRRRLGDANGTGYAIDESPGEQQLLARQATLDQPMLSRDPVGPGRIGDEPSDWTAPPGEGGPTDTVQLPVPTFASSSESQAVGMAPAPIDPTVEARHDAPPPPEDVEPAQPTAQPAVAMSAPAAAARSDATARPGPRVAADPAPQGESELDPVAVVGSMDFRSGSTTVRAGRKHKIIRPRLTLDAKLDLVTMGSTFLVLRMRLDDSGNVTSSEIVRSSGSDSLDQVFKVTSYEWWFEPARDVLSSKPVADDFRFVIRIN